MNVARSQQWWMKSAAITNRPRWLPQEWRLVIARTRSERALREGATECVASGLPGTEVKPVISASEGIMAIERQPRENMMAIEVQSKTWLERVEANRFDDWTKEHMIKEMPHTYFIGYLPLALAFLQGRFVDLGFENLGLSSLEHRAIMLAFGGTGVRIPGTQLRMRFAYPHAVIEPVDGGETATLPTWWREGVLVTDDQGIPTWVGKKVRPDQTAGIDLQQYKDLGEGLTPP
jgi:hypothetical protein